MHFIIQLPKTIECTGFCGGSDGKVSAWNAGDLGSIPGSGRSPGEGNGNPLQYSCHGKFHGWRNLVGYFPWGCKESDMTEKLHFKCTGFPGGSEVKVSAWNAGDLGSIPASGRSPGERKGNPLQYSCLEATVLCSKFRTGLVSFFFSHTRIPTTMPGIGSDTYQGVGNLLVDTSHKLKILKSTNYTFS